MSEFPDLFPVNGSGGGKYMSGWDLCVLGGDRLPGLAEVSTNGLKLTRDSNRAPGKNGGKPVYTGLDEQEVKIKVIVWTQSQLDILWGLRSKLLPLPGKQPENVSIDSPWLKLIGINSVAVTAVSGMQRHTSARVPRGVEVTITASHWLGASKGAGKNVTAQPKRNVSTTRPYKGATSPVNSSGACGPPNYQPG